MCESVCVYVSERESVRVCESVCVNECVCVRERVRERERDTDRSLKLSESFSASSMAFLKLVGPSIDRKKS